VQNTAYSSSVPLLISPLDSVSLFTRHFALVINCINMLHLYLQLRIQAFLHHTVINAVTENQCANGLLASVANFLPLMEC